MIKEEKSEIKYRMKRLARKFCRRNNVYESFDSSVGELIEKAYFSVYLLCLHENKNRIAELERKLEQTEKDLADYQFNYLIIKELQKEKAELKEKLKADLIAELKEQMQYSTSPSCTKGMELFIKSIEKWEIKEKYVQNICDCDICDTYCNSQFTKAKDILKRLVSLSNNSRSLLGGTWHETVREAEQFLNSEVNK